jgi:hypothetical protein
MNFKFFSPLTSTLSLLMISALFNVASAEDVNPILEEADLNTSKPGVSPVRRLDRQQTRRPHQIEPNTNPDIRTFDGSENNETETDMGSVHIHLTRIIPNDYADGISAMAGVSRPSARVISNIVSAQSDSMPNAHNASDMLWQWGQFLDHDIDLTDGTEPTEAEDIVVPNGDPYFDPAETGSVVIPFNRSIYDKESGLSTDNPRQQLNEISAWIDASNVYGSDIDRANALRTLDGTGKLKTSAGNLLPFNTEGYPNAGGESSALFLAGDVRANEQVGLASMHTLFVREHNRLANIVTQQNPELSGDEIYQKVRKLVGAEMQIITYQEYLPALLGLDALKPYDGYKPSVDASISNLFSTASYRYGHSALSPTLLRLDAQGNEITEGHLALRDAFFSPQRLINEGGIEPILRGLTSQICQSIDPFVIDDVRNFLFGAPGSGGFDLVALNIQRGRDHGLPSYNDVREYLGLPSKKDFSEVSSNTEIQSRLASAYTSVDDIDAWVGGLSEDPVNGGMVGELVRTILIKQFEALRDGDRFWYQRDLSWDELRMVQGTRLSTIIRRNTTIGSEIPANVFKVSDSTNTDVQFGRKRLQRGR